MVKHILVISPTPTHPTITGSRARIVAMIAGLKRMGHIVHFLHIDREPGDPDQMRAAWGDAFHLCSYTQPKKNSSKFLKKIKKIFSTDSVYRLTIDEWWDDTAGETIVRLQNKFKFDVVMVEYVFYSKALTYFSADVLKILDTHDVFTDRHKLYLKNGMTPQWFSTSKDEETKALNRADVVIAIQDKERDFFSGLVKKPVVSVGHMVTLIAPESKIQSYKMLYLGSKNPINIESIQKFMDNVLTKVRQALPQSELLIGGSICEQLPEIEGVTKLGIVDDLATAYKMADVVVNPMLYGTGLKIKSIEALGYSKPLVTSPVGAEGLEDGSGEAFLVASSDDMFAMQIINILTDASVSSRLSQAAYDYASRYNDVILSNLKPIIEESKAC